MNVDLYLTLEEYNDFVSKAHSQYMINRLQHTPAHAYKKHHPADLAIETASFFEASYLVLDSYLDVVTARIRDEREAKQKPVEEFFDLKPTNTETKKPKKERKQVKER
jgi:hypothetical protein